jgi:hypothetical protein
MGTCEHDGHCVKNRLSSQYSATTLLHFICAIELLSQPRSREKHEATAVIFSIGSHENYPFKPIWVSQ